MRNALAATLPGSDGQPDSVGARLAAAQAASRLALAEAQVLHLNSTLQTTQVRKHGLGSTCVMLLPSHITAFTLL